MIGRPVCRRRPLSVSDDMASAQLIDDGISHGDETSIVHEVVKPNFAVAALEFGLHIRFRVAVIFSVSCAEFCRRKDVTDTLLTLRTRGRMPGGLV